jgi:lauroyl/myristoyl acyltransferase
MLKIGNIPIVPWSNLNNYEQRSAKMIFTKLIPWRVSLNVSKFFQLKFNCYLLRFLPFFVSRWYIIFIGKVYYLFHKKERGLIQQTIGHVLNRKNDARKIKIKIKETFKGIFDHYHEKLFIAYSHFPRLLRFLHNQIRLVGSEALDHALQSGKGVILVTGHYGAVEMLPGALAVQGYPTAMICRFQTSRLRQSLYDRAERVGLKLIDADAGDILLAALRVLKQGRILITECDEFDEWRDDYNRSTYFLNTRLPYDRSLDLLRKRTGAAVVTALVHREGNGRYAMNLTPVANGKPAHPPSVSQECLAILEQAIDTNPEQWYQWKKLGKIIKSRLEAEHDRQESGYLAPEVGISLPDQA